MNEKINISDQLSAYLDGELDNATAKLVAEALANDPGLAKELDELRATRQIVRESLPALRAPDNFAERVAQATAKKQASKNVTPTRWTFGRQTLAVAAVVLFAIGAGVVISYQMNQHMQPGQPDDALVAIAPKVEIEAEKYDADIAEAKLYKDIVDDNLAGGEVIASLDKKDIAKSSAAFGRKKSVEKLAMADAPADSVKELAEAKPEVLAIATEPRSEKLAAKPTAPAATPMVALRAPAPVLPKGASITHDTSQARGMAKAKTQPAESKIVKDDLVKLADRSRAGNNEIVWTDNMRLSQQVVERTLVSNGFEIAPERQNKVLSNQAINLNNSLGYNLAKRRVSQKMDKQIEYLIVGDERQLTKLRTAIRNDLQQRQRVSQLPEPLFRQALQEEHAATTQAREDFASKPKQSPPSSRQSAMKREHRKKSTHKPAGQQTMLITLNYRSQAKLNRSQADAIKQAELDNKILPPRTSQPATPEK